MNSVTAAFPDRKLHVILDNLNSQEKRPGDVAALREARLTIGEKVDGSI